MKKCLMVLLSLSLLFALSVPVLADVVKPNADFYVLDAAGVLTRETQAHIIYNNDRLYEACGAQIAFVTVGTTGSIKPADYVY
ncbi:MAG: TPM domain-containing protein, partial [Eubacteriales bacterium]|nr:TPM domain-containing protein [Eubacteriales bacterium]